MAWGLRLLNAPIRFFAEPSFRNPGPLPMIVGLVLVLPLLRVRRIRSLLLPGLWTVAWFGMIAAIVVHRAWLAILVAAITGFTLVLACAPPFAGPVLASIARVRDREVLAVDEARGLVVYRTFEDLPAAGRENAYPLTYQVVELFHFVDGKIERVEAFTSELPYGMRPH